MIQKFFGEQGGIHGSAPLQWPGTVDGFPVRGAPGNLKQDEYDDIQLAVDFKCKTFCLWEEADRQEFEKIRDYIANTWFGLQYIERHFIPEQKNLLIYMEWIQVYGETPNAKLPPSRAKPRTNAAAQRGSDFVLS